MSENTDQPREGGEHGWIDYWCNGFTPDRLERWDAAIAAQRIPLKIRRREEDSFVDVSGMLERMDEIGVGTLLLPCADVPKAPEPTNYALFASRVDDVVDWARQYPGRFAGLVTIDPTAGLRGVRRAAEILREPGFVGLQIHTHSWNRPFDHRDFYPYYALAAEHGVPVVMQAGTSGGREPSRCGLPILIDEPALYFEDVDFVLSHTGWPWVEEALAMAGKHANVFLGTAAFPPHHWSAELLRFMRGVGRGKVMLGTSFPVVGHRHALTKLAELGLEEPVRQALLSETALRVFRRLDRKEARGPAQVARPPT